MWKRHCQRKFRGNGLCTEVFEKKELSRPITRKTASFLCQSTKRKSQALDDSVFRKYGDQLELVGTWWSGQHKRVVDGIDGVLLLVVIGDGKLIVPVDFALRRPNPTGPGRRCRTKLG